MTTPFDFILGNDEELAEAVEHEVFPGLNSHDTSREDENLLDAVEKKEFPDLDSDEEEGYESLNRNYDLEDAYDTFDSPPPGDAAAKLPPAEAEAAAQYMAPYSEDERDIMERTPFLDGLRKVDDPDHQRYLIELMKARSKGMDTALDDVTYGEERLDRIDSDDESGRFGMSKLRAAGRGIKKGVKAAGGAMSALAARPFKALIGRFRNKMSSRRAHAIAWQRRKSTTPNAAENAEAKKWTQNWLLTKGGKRGRLVAKISGGDFVGANFVGGEFVGKSFVGFVDPVTLGVLMGVGIPTLTLILKAFLDKASKQGAPKNPQAAPADGEAMPASEEAAPSAEAEPSAEAAPAPAAEEASSDDASEGVDHDAIVGDLLGL